ncbi:hypothetical protein G4B88_003233 [Cannabis sativa]|uniref:PPM-type phosphatase domain-containing protein n=1 Tax=Cannabis sativa TaxID=3483 RepID=A0A7J6I3Y5_CANSA|nr:hypothetical protein G4B88_003233 [Cannabis sativa]
MALTLNSPPPSNLSWVSPLFVGPLLANNNSNDDHIHNDEYNIKNIEAHKEEEDDDDDPKRRRFFLQEKVIIGDDKGARSEMMNLNEGGDWKGNKHSGSCRLRKRPSSLVVPKYPGVGGGQELCDEKAGITRRFDKEEVEVVEGRDFFLAAKKGMRMSMEDGYGVLVDIKGDSKQAFFAVMDGHGGCAATDYVAENLGKNIVKGLEDVPNSDEEKVEEAIREGYLVTDKEFLSQGVSSGACAASVLVKKGKLHVANVGDCRVILSRKGVAHVLTNDHRLTTREDERLRIENSGGFVHCRNGVWRVQGSLAVSRAIGDQHLKEWIYDQEAVDIVARENSTLKACKKLVDMSSSRGNMDDITVMVVKLQNFMHI